MELSIIVVNYNNYNLTENCVKSVLRTVKDIKFEIIVIDNNSLIIVFIFLVKDFGIIMLELLRILIMRGLD